MVERLTSCSGYAEKVDDELRMFILVDADDIVYKSWVIYLCNRIAYFHGLLRQHHVQNDNRSGQSEEKATAPDGG